MGKLRNGNMEKIVDAVVALCAVLLVGSIVLATGNREKEKTSMEDRITVLEHKCDSLQRQIDFMVE